MQRLVRSDLGPFRARWDELVVAMPDPTPFAMSWWLDRTCLGKPRYVLLVEGSDLVGGMAFQVVRWRGAAHVEFMGQGPLSPTFPGVLARAGQEAPVAESVVHWLIHKPVASGPRVVDLRLFDAAGSLARALAAFGAPLEEFEVSPFAEIGTDHDAYLQSRSGRIRHSWRDAGKRLAKADVTFRSIVDIDVERALDDLHRLHKLRWGEDSAFTPEWARFRAAALDGAAAGVVTVWEAAAPEGVVASCVGFVVGSRCLLYQVGIDPRPEFRGAGTWLWQQLILAGPEISRLDLGPGGQDYKQMWATGASQLLRSRFGVGFGGSTMVSASRWRQQVRSSALRLRPPATRDRQGPYTEEPIGAA